jgi:hypothetical protein
MKSLHTPNRPMHRDTSGAEFAANATAAASPQATPAARMPAPADRERAIRELAYAFFEARGRAEGHELEDWLKAEAQVLAQAAPDAADAAGTPQ